MVFAFFSEDFEKVSGDKTENNDMMDSFEARKKRKMAKKEQMKKNGTKMNLK